MLFQAVYRRFCLRNNGILTWRGMASRNRVAKTPDFSIGVNVASMGVVMGRAGVFGGRFCGVLFAGFFAMFLYFWGRIRVAVFAGYSGKVVLFL